MSTWEAQLHGLLGQWKQKLYWDTTSHPLHWLKFKSLTLPSADEDTEQ